MKIAFTGHRNKITNTDELDRIAIDYPDSIWLHGGAIGFDSQVNDFALLNNIQQIVIKPNYSRFGKGAPLVRNKEIVSQADLLIACYDGRKNGGTCFTINYAHKINIPIKLIPIQKTPK